MVLTMIALFIACTGVHCELKYQHWPVKQTFFVDQKGCQWHMYPHNSDKTIAQESEISTKKLMFTATEGPTHMPLLVLG
jgi:hypothetical protein